MPIYNGSKYMAEAIDSILNQTYKNFEFIAVNDNSTDSTWEILKSYKKRYPKIRIINLTSQNGPFKAVNKAIRYVKGEFIAPMDSDDISHPKRLEKEVEFMLSHQDAIVIGTYTRIIDSYGNIIGKKTFATKNNDIYRQFFEVHPIVHPSSMVRRSLLPNKNILYEIKFGINDDYYTFYRLLKYGKFANIPEFLFYYRIHLNNNSLQGTKGKFLNSVKIRILALIKMGYVPSPVSAIKFLAQLAIVPLVPEKQLLTLYLVIMGFYKPADFASKFAQRLNASFAKVKNFSFTLLRAA